MSDSNGSRAEDDKNSEVEVRELTTDEFAFASQPRTAELRTPPTQYSMSDVACLIKEENELLAYLKSREDSHYATRKEESRILANFLNQLSHVDDNSSIRVQSGDSIYVKQRKGPSHYAMTELKNFHDKLLHLAHMSIGKSGLKPNDDVFTAIKETDGEFPGFQSAILDATINTETNSGSFGLFVVYRDGECSAAVASCSFTFEFNPNAYFITSEMNGKFFLKHTTPMLQQDSLLQIKNYIKNTAKMSRIFDDLKFTLPPRVSSLLALLTCFKCTGSS